jgi:hypothetical protein
MRRTGITAVIIILALIILLLIYQYVFSIYEITYSVKPESLFADNTSTVTIAAVPLNSFGREAPFRTAEVTFEIKEGSELVEPVSHNPKEGYIILRAGDKTGTVVLLARSKKSLLPALIEIQIFPVTA